MHLISSLDNVKQTDGFSHTLLCYAMLVLTHSRLLKQ